MYDYDPLGRRIAKSKLNKQGEKQCHTQFIWAGSHLVQEIRKGNHQQNAEKTDRTFTYIYTHPDSYEPLAQCYKESENAQHTVNYFHCDQIGVPREMTDSQGKLLWKGRYDAWGQLIHDSNRHAQRTTHQPFRLQNQYFDQETGLHYNFLRYYEPALGRFITQDPIGLMGGMNVYQFAENIQIWVDPLGLNKCNDKRCAELRAQIFHKSQLLIKEFQKYNPVQDGIGGFPMRGGGVTKPGGHYQEMNDLKRGLKNDIKEYIKNCQGNDRCDGGGKWGAIPRKIDALANRPVPEPVFQSNQNSIGDYAALIGLGVLTVGLALLPFDGPI